MVAFAGRTHVSLAEWVVQDTQQIHVLWLGKVRSTTAVLQAPSCSYLHVEVGSYTTFFTFSFRNSKLRIEGELCSMVSTVFFTLRTNKYIQNFNRKLRELPDQKEGQWPTQDIPGDRKPSVSQLCL